MRTISIDDWQELENLPHGAVVTAGDKQIVMNREDPYVVDPYFDCGHGEWLATNHVFSFFDVESVVIEPPLTLD